MKPFSGDRYSLLARRGCRRSARCTQCSDYTPHFFYSHQWQLKDHVPWYCVLLIMVCFLIFHLFNIKTHTLTKLKTSFSESSKMSLWTKSIQIHYFQYSGIGLREKIFLNDCAQSFRNIQAIKTMAWICAMQEYVITEQKMLHFFAATDNAIKLSWRSMWRAWK